MKTHVNSALLSVAVSQLGVRETNDNSGARVQEYQDATTLDGTHWPWCAAFVAWCLQQTAKRLGLLIPWSNSASCDVLLTDARARGLLRKTPQPGDVFLVRARLKSGKFSEHDMIHTGIVESVKTNGTFTEIAGNTNLDGGREGIGVFRTTRITGDRYYFVRAVDGIAEAQLGKIAVKSEAATPLTAPRPWSASIQIARGGAGGSVRGLACKLEGSTVLVAIRDWADITGQSVVFIPEEQSVQVDGKEIPLQARLYAGSDGNPQAHYSIRALAELFGGFMMVNESARTAKAVFS